MTLYWTRQCNDPPLWCNRLRLNTSVPHQETQTAKNLLAAAYTAHGVSKIQHGRTQQPFMERVKQMKETTATRTVITCLWRQQHLLCQVQPSGFYSRLFPQSSHLIECSFIKSEECIAGNGHAGADAFFCSSVPHKCVRNQRFDSYN